jgi:hypothetical protein
VTAPQQPKILGGAFGIETPELSHDRSEPPFSGPHIQYFLNVRCALKALCDVHRPTHAWLPSYLCTSLLQPFEICGVPVRYYAVDERLICSDEDFLSEIRPGDFLVLIHYFGFPQGLALAAKAHARGALVIEDASQALFLKQQFPGSTCVLYSPRKFLGVPDGAIMVSDRETGTGGMSLVEPPQDWWKLAVAMSLKRRDFDLTGQQNNWFDLFRRTESDIPVGAYRASQLSRIVLEGMDYGLIKARRRTNYACLLKHLKQYALFTEYKESSAPLGFPVRVPRRLRDPVLLHLHKAGIFAPVHWPCEAFVPPSFRASHEIATTVLTLLCDQRYAESDMERQADEFKSALAVSGAGE